MSKSCIMAPVHRPGFKFGLNWVKTYNEHFDDDNIFLVFSNDEEYQEFKNLAEGLRYRSIVCREELYCSKPISQKKIIGVQHIFKNYDFDKVGVMDVDTEFINHIDYDKSFSKYVERNTIYGSHINNQGIIDGPARGAAMRFFNTEDVIKLSTLTDNFRNYFWFNDIPIYEKKHFNNFLDYIDYVHVVERIGYPDFDYILYVYYLLVNDLIKLDIYEIDGNKPSVVSNGSFLESQNQISKDYVKEVYKKYKPMWIKYPIDEGMDNVFLRMHIDRS